MSDSTFWIQHAGLHGSDSGSGFKVENWGYHWVQVMGPVVDGQRTHGLHGDLRWGLGFGYPGLCHLFRTPGLLAILEFALA